jgi:ERCC4-type nuclease
LASETESEPEVIELEELDGIGAKAAENLREAGYDTDEKLVEASDEELLDVSWVGEKALFSLKEAVQAHPPQQRWGE